MIFEAFSFQFHSSFSPHFFSALFTRRDIVIIVMSTTLVELDPSSCSKIFSHVLKHPHSDVSGLLLTSSSSDDGDDDDVVVHVLDAIPLFHCESIDCAAMNEIALAHAHAHATSKNARICGMYFANGRNFTTFITSNNNDEKEEEEQLLLLPDRAKGLADAIEHNTTREDKERGVRMYWYLLLDAGKLKSFVEDPSSTLAPFRVFSRSESNNKSECGFGGGSALKERADIPARVVRGPLASADERRRWFDRNVADFDDHFDDVSKDWRNTTT